MAALPRITFGVIVLNGEPFTRYCLRALYPFAHQIVVVEGAVGRAMGQARPDGHSRDGTLETLYDFKANEDPDGKLVVVTQDGPWEEKDAMSAAFAARATGDWLWQVDIDEFYRTRDMELVCSLLAGDPSITGAVFRQWSFFGSPGIVNGSSYLLAGGDAFRRLFRWGPGYRYAGHRPPTILDDRGLDVLSLRPLSAEALEAMDVRLFHYSLLFPKQVRDKTAYYAAWTEVPHCRDLPRWCEEQFLGRADPFNLFTVRDQPGWIESYTGDHPEQVAAMLGDIAAGRLAVEPYPADGLAALARDPGYRRRIGLLKGELLGRPDPAARNMRLGDPFFQKRVLGRVPGIRGVLVNQLDAYGGAARIALDLGRSLNAGPDDFTYFVWKKKLPDYWIETIGQEDKNRPAKAAAEAMGLPDYNVASTFLLAERRAFQEAQVVHCHNLHTGYCNPMSAAGWSVGKPLVWTLHDMQGLTGNCAHAFACPGWRTGCGDCPDLRVYPGLATDTTAELWRDKATAGQALDAHIAVPSEWLKRQVEESFLAHLPVHVIPNGIDTDTFAPRDRQAARRELGLPPGATILSFCAHGGLANSWKGGAHLVAALAALVERHPEVVLLNIGGTYEDAGLPIVNLPFSLDAARLATAYAASDVFAYPSLADTFGLVALEALCCGLPVVSFDAGALPEIVRDGENGLVTLTGDTEAFTRALSRLITDRDLRQTLAANAPSARDSYGLPAMVARYRDLYQHVMAERAARSPAARRDLARRQGPALATLAARLAAVGNTVGATALNQAARSLPA
ncbi:glycosyl transferase group 1 [Solidesulfovibrio carbinoliphilus subsp. oakridgensis]|uniref:Glycosyl transferase group 1 n=1 Tax=Solidesulfovibrio carbinoliphilus subsp. oakridgensis TaxID=694327 RepID=G7Q7P1_9BACT|nr:glycosyltransferase [Solidesulfovibrio carbinoliphilus]EHJ47350.1 glycosyl transferase group 1 [Solidesulfovibrio carbinoliphilus subsp. oakridgensis]